MKLADIVASDQDLDFDTLVFNVVQSFIDEDVTDLYVPLSKVMGSCFEAVMNLLDADKDDLRVRDFIMFYTDRYLNSSMVHQRINAYEKLKTGRITKTYSDNNFNELITNMFQLYSGISMFEHDNKGANKFVHLIKPYRSKNEMIVVLNNDFNDWDLSGEPMSVTAEFLHLGYISSELILTGTVKDKGIRVPRLLLKLKMKSADKTIMQDIILGSSTTLFSYTYEFGIVGEERMVQIKLSPSHKHTGGFRRW